MRCFTVFACTLQLGLQSACHSQVAPHHQAATTTPTATAAAESARMQDSPRDGEDSLYQGTLSLDPEQREYARVSRERLRAIEIRAEHLKERRQGIPPAAQGDVAATLNLLPQKCDETEREIDALETITSEKWQQKRHHVDRKLVNLERSLDRAQAR